MLAAALDLAAQGWAVLPCLHADGIDPRNPAKEAKAPWLTTGSTRRLAIPR